MNDSWMHRIAGVSVAGTILWCAAAMAVSAANWAPISESADGIRAACAGIWLLLSLASSVVFLIAAARHCPGRAANCAGCALALFTLIIPIAAGRAIHNRLRTQDEVQRTTRMIISLHRLGAEVEAIRTRLGRLPADEEELVKLRGKPMPPEGEKYRISYRRRDDNHYDLSYCARDFWGRHWDLFGWIFHYFGSSSPQRLHAELF